MPQHPSTIPPDQLLIRTVAELRRCIDIISRIEDEIIPLAATPIALSLRTALQDMDLLTQCIEDIARCLAGLSLALDGRGTVETETVLLQIRLQDMRLRLEGGSFDSKNQPPRAEIFGVI